MPLCGPARASILTSLYVHVHGCSTNLAHPRFVAKGLDRDTVATRMTAAGYHTGYFGKYMNGHGQQPRYVAPGWNRWVTVVDTHTTINVDGAVRVLGSHREVDRFTARRLRRFIRHHRDTGPWFAVFAPDHPHFPYTPSREHAHDFDHVIWDPPALNEPDMSDKPTFMRDLPRQAPNHMRRVLEGKLEELQDLDDQIGRVLDLLRETGQRRRTWIFLVSDNGLSARRAPALPQGAALRGSRPASRSSYEARSFSRCGRCSGVPVRPDADHSRHRRPRPRCRTRR